MVVAAHWLNPIPKSPNEHFAWIAFAVDLLLFLRCSDVISGIDWVNACRFLATWLPRLACSTTCGIQVSHHTTSTTIYICELRFRGFIQPKWNNNKYIILLGRYLLMALSRASTSRVHVSLGWLNAQRMIFDFGEHKTHQPFQNYARCVPILMDGLFCSYSHSHQEQV